MFRPHCTKMLVAPPRSTVPRLTVTKGSSRWHEQWNAVQLNGLHAYRGRSRTGGADGKEMAAVDVLIEETSLKVSVPYLLALLNFVYEALPPAPTDQQRELQRAVEGAAAAATGGAGGSAGAPQQSAARRRLPSDNTSGYHSVVSGAAQDDAHSVSFSLVLKKPEIVFFADPREHESEVIVLKVKGPLVCFCFFLSFSFFGLQLPCVCILTNQGWCRAQLFFVAWMSCAERCLLACWHMLCHHSNQFFTQYAILEKILPWFGLTYEYV